MRKENRAQKLWRKRRSIWWWQTGQQCRRKHGWSSKLIARRNAHEMALPTYIHAGRFSCEREKKHKNVRGNGNIGISDFWEKQKIRLCSKGNCVILPL